MRRAFARRIASTVVVGDQRMAGGEATRHPYPEQEGGGYDEGEYHLRLDDRGIAQHEGCRRHRDTRQRAAYRGAMPAVTQGEDDDGNGHGHAHALEGRTVQL